MSRFSRNSCLFDKRSDFYTELHENMTNGSICHGRTDGLTWSPYKASFLLRKGDLN